jgi:uncharacterized membrane protein YoaK (UPF0700 family)
MPINYARRLTGPRRSAQANRHLGYALAFIAGASNAGGFLAVHQYTSHMTGIVATAADSLALNDYLPVLAASGALLSFITGAAVTAIIVNYARRHRMSSEYALPLLLEAILLLCFGILGARLAGIHGLFVPLTVMLLCFIMGLQNAVMTKLSGAEIRTTHLTGTVTDIGIELGKLFYWNADPSQDKIRVVANRAPAPVSAAGLFLFHRRRGRRDGVQARRLPVDGAAGAASVRVGDRAGHGRCAGIHAQACRKVA